jgi:hypothetical protein
MNFSRKLNSLVEHLGFQYKEKGGGALWTPPPDDSKESKL